MKCRVDQKERLLMGKLPTGEWRRSFLMRYQLSEDSMTEIVDVPWLGASGRFENRELQKCGPEDVPRVMALRAIFREAAKRFGPDAFETVGQTLTHRNDTLAFIEIAA